MTASMGLDEIYTAYMADPDFQNLRKSFHFVPGVGNPNADIMLVGEAPGANEDKKREPFVGRAGEILDVLLSGGNYRYKHGLFHSDGVGLSRDDLFITNVLKYRPSTENRDPTVAELQFSLPYLVEEIITVNPKLIISLGKIPTSVFYPGKLFKNIRGNVYEYANAYKVLVTYHPAAAIYNPQRILPELEEHFSLVRGALDDNFRGVAFPPRAS